MHLTPKEEGFRVFQASREAHGKIKTIRKDFQDFWLVEMIEIEHKMFLGQHKT